MLQVHNIEMRFDAERGFSNQHGESFHFPANSLLPGQLTLTPSDGPLGERAYEHPSYLELTFTFLHQERLRVHRGLLWRFDLWLEDGCSVQTSYPDFVSHSGQIDELMDSRSDLSYFLPDGRKHTFRVKYTGCFFDLMIVNKGFIIRCRYHDPKAIGAVDSHATVFYQRKFADLIFLPALKLGYDSHGKAEEFFAHGADYVFVE
jgi:hypothetical protein